MRKRFLVFGLFLSGIMFLGILCTSGPPVSTNTSRLPPHTKSTQTVDSALLKKLELAKEDADKVIDANRFVALWVGRFSKFAAVVAFILSMILAFLTGRNPSSVAIQTPTDQNKPNLTFWLASGMIVCQLITAGASGVENAYYKKVHELNEMVLKSVPKDDQGIRQDILKLQKLTNQARI